MRKFLFLLGLLLPAVAVAEPFLAVENGFQCNQCHVNPTGGGLRNSFGSVFSQTGLPSNSGASPGLLGMLNERVAMGADVRGSGRMIDNETQDDNVNFSIDRVTVYIHANLTDSLDLYIDQQFAPGSSLNREAWAKYSIGNAYVRAGKLFQPYGLRLEDDSAFIRQSTNINFNTPDNGLEIGYVDQVWSLQVAVTNGTGGTNEVDDGKQVTGRASWNHRFGRFGFSASNNRTHSVDRNMYGVFAGIKTGPVSWLMEFDVIEDKTTGFNQEQDVAFIEGNLRISQGHYFKLTAERRTSPGSSFLDSDRYGIEYQWFPVSFTQLRAGYRTSDGDPAVASLNTDEAYLQLHFYF